MPPTPRSEGPKKAKVPTPGGDSSRRGLIIGGVIGLVILIAIGGYFGLAGGSSSGGTGTTASSDGTKKLAAAGCTVTSVKSLPAGDHSVTTPEGTSKKWNTSPPTSGPHYATPAVWGSFTAPLNQAQLVHNLEHGGIFIQYGKNVPQATIDELQNFYDGHRNGTILAPLPSLGTDIALGVWTVKDPSNGNDGTAHLVKCKSFDEAAYAAFFKAYQFQGPERFPMDQLLPGT